MSRKIQSFGPYTAEEMLLVKQFLGSRPEGDYKESKMVKPKW
jgi:hypothetical protein